MRALSLSFRLAVLWCLALALPGCIDPYMPDAISTTKSYLVVDGFINSRGSTSIKLSRTFDIDAKTAPPIETRATLFIEEEGGTRYAVPETSVKGTYTSASLTLNPAKNYRLSIRTSAGLEYASTFVPVKTTPPIDAVTWRPSENGLTIYINTHDDTNTTKYYRWEYEETWEIKPPYYPQIEYKNGQMQDITVPFPTICWGNSNSSEIKISNTTRLTQDVVADFPLRALPITSDRLAYRYSILVKQYAQTAEEYIHWDLLKRNTENIGTLFDPLPTQLTGNVQCLNNAAELALGYVGAHSTEQKRIFISRTELPRNWRVTNGYENCVPPDTVFLKNTRLDGIAALLQSNFSSPLYLPIDVLYLPTGRVSGYLAKSNDCIDCRTRGTAVKPSFWP
ncbi:DUF4249 domain-containing protein [Hymenobacter sp. BT186]|uniref:DUF4249 domain-containing protein n=1 Tax=Hymenobacter telluris TaxID=2816474 RepID=A0A939J903_9BACT|nr:DUF4249 domain-containing protein [Hymenobacter telluris]MBO0358299.1 DUF4249 domain-containing protein [Hymenobacter telluris]MBW3374325.1 DUF4249 domain-containing protein [Hymenobacter norwichensis]